MYRSKSNPQPVLRPQDLVVLLRLLQEPTVPKAAARNPALYELLALLDAIRGGSLRVQALTIELLNKRWAP